jgi:peptidoglycan/LPS O-acetylase OafA/YrhL
LFSKPELVWLGERSYSLFLTHYAVIAVVCDLTAGEVSQKGVLYFAMSRVCSLIASLVVACALFQLVEARFAHGLATARQLVPWGGHGLHERAAI